MIKEFEQIAGTLCKAAYVVCKIGLHFFKARIDTGADITIIPLSLLPTKSLVGNKVVLLGHNGMIDRVLTKIVTIEIEELGIFTPERGVLTSESNPFLIGMDILKFCTFSMEGGIFILELLEEKK